MRLYLVLLIYLAGALAGLAGFPYACALFLWNDFFQPLYFARYPGYFPAAYAVLAVLVASFLIQLLRGRLAPRGNFFLAYTPVYLGWVAICAAASPYRGPALDGFLEILKYLLPLMLISAGLEGKAQVRLVALAITLSVAVWSIQAGVHGLVRGVSRDMSIPGGQMTDNNDFMAATDSILPMLLYFTAAYSGRFRLPVKGLGFLAFALSFAAVVFSDSRGAALGIASTAVLYVILVSRHRFRDAAVILAAAAVILLLLPQSFWDRMHTIRLGKEQTEDSAAERMYMMTCAFRAALDHPLFGLGPRCWLQAAPSLCGKFLDPHDIWLKLAAEIGVPGLILYLIMPAVTVYRLLGLRRRALRAGQGEAGRLAEALVMAIIGYIMPSTFLNHPFSEFLWSWYAIGNALVSTYRPPARKAVRRARTARPGPDPEPALPPEP